MQISYLVFAVLTLRIAPIAGVDSMVKRPVIQPFVCPCEYIFEPVCGSDGITYTNECLLQCYSKMGAMKGKPPVTVCADGIACSECRCQPLDQPVCSVDGETYSSECELSCENYRRAQDGRPLAYLAYRAACLGPPSKCPTVASPVCGSDDILYRNQCELNCASTNSVAKGLYPIELKNVGACIDACSCPDVKYPVCGSDGREYDNLCRIACANRKQTCSLSRPVEPAPTKTCISCSCEAKYNPVCASDGKLQPRTFANACEVRCEAQRTDNPFLYPLGFGVCPTCFCTGQKQPVCGTDRKTYTNECELRCANDARPKGEAPIGLFHAGPCQATEDCECSYCSIDYMPVCGSDNVTYWNLCWLTCNSNCAQKQNGKQLYLASKGACYL